MPAPTSPTLSTPLSELAALALDHDGLDVIVLHGSRARGDGYATSDWDIGYLGARVDHFQLLADISEVLNTDAVDLVDLRKASAILRYRAARDGHLIFEQQSGAFTEFVIAATLHWCDIEPVVRRAHHRILAGLRK
jgi:predicted nucleotidyltransferase